MLLRQESISPTRVRLYFESDLEGATFYVWLDGRLYGTTGAGTMEIPVGLGRVIQVDVFDEPVAAPSVWYPATVTLWWEGAGDTALFRVEQWVEDAWVIRTQVPAVGANMPRWESAPLADGETHTFRVVPVDGTGRDGVAREFSGVMCRYPSAPVAAVDVSGGEFVISDL
jgi:hypothetical protein